MVASNGEDNYRLINCNLLQDQKLQVLNLSRSNISNSLYWNEDVSLALSSPEPGLN